MHLPWSASTPVWVSMSFRVHLVGRLHHNSALAMSGASTSWPFSFIDCRLASRGFALLPLHLLSPCASTCHSTARLAYSIQPYVTSTPYSKFHPVLLAVILVDDGKPDSSHTSKLLWHSVHCTTSWSMYNTTRGMVEVVSMRNLCNICSLTLLWHCFCIVNLRVRHSEANGLVSELKLSS